MSTPISDTFSGLGALLRGLGTVLRKPKLFLLGATPPLVTSVLFLVALIALIGRIEDITAWMTPFADGWTEAWTTTLRVALGIALVVGAVLVMVVGFTGVTLALGSPIYDKIAEDVEDVLGNAPPESEEPLVASAVRGVRQSLTLVLISVVVTVLLFAAGFIPIIGQTVVPVVSVLIGAWLLCTELVGAAFERRGMRKLRDRRRHMANHKARVLGFSVPCFLLLAIPGVAVAVFPAAAAGGTILARQILPPVPNPGRPEPGMPPQNTPPQPPPAGPPQNWRA
ncbi:CysZ protein [Lipingzhangella halophila]|uniref:CysZ protein n=1 Tax=Lipingzhangella halophila TaxID=1783352 RepID=A0A7W7RKD1_9ACTN|nr:EI24 domain-containing protein [Lipingzhangella halophila]MBB4933587.1 CysZ protein [Lipingzhangella halophila]